MQKTGLQNWVIGKSGQLGRALLDIDSGLFGIDRTHLDLSQPAKTVSQILSDTAASRGKPDIIYLTAAYTDVDGAEQHAGLAGRINGDAPQAIANWCKAHNVALIYISTDYVFDGTSDAPYGPEDTAKPLNAYGRSKYAGEQAVLKSGCAGAIIRTSWLYDAAGPNFLTAMINQDRRGNPLRVVDDQIGRPTYAPDLARALLKAGEMLAQTKPPARIFHATAGGVPVSWAGFARAILPAAQITPVSSGEFARPAARPAYSVLDTHAFEAVFNLSLPGWRESLDLALKDVATRR